MFHLEKWPIRWVNNEVVGLSSSQKRPRVLAANSEQNTSQQRALAGDSSSSSLATAKGQGRGFTSSCSVLVRPHLGQHSGKAGTNCSKPSTSHENARDARDVGRDCRSRAHLPWRKAGSGGHPTAAPAAPVLVSEDAPGSYMVQGGAENTQPSILCSHASVALYKQGMRPSRPREREENGMETMEDGLWILNTDQHSKSGAEQRPAPNHGRLKGFSRPTTIS
ncbi:hypothetical protein DUI87_15427 [Hirundo rustica rustica]|uniref:Uncharacterized protein n=1 Tax=Hirundo rustica rustica TaxID=333673 RepID=A0A3M0K443_HIRRU|nr:hypothetical protein DUI87_15427 [Hirundo rustica rustica]